MADLTDVKIELGLVYRDVVLADSPILYWRLDEESGATAADSSGNSRDGTHLNTPTLGVSGATADGNKAATYVRANSEETDSADVAALRITGALSFECWMRFTTGSQSQGIGGVRPAANEGYMLAVDSVDRVYGRIGNGSTQTNTQWSSAITISTWYHVVLTYATPNVKLYVNGVERDTDTITGPVDYSTDGTEPLKIGQIQNLFLDGDVDEVAVYDVELTAAQVLAHYDAGIWKENTDVIANESIAISYGIPGNRPLDRVASTGRLSFSLRNDDGNSAGVEGLYSPNHTNALPGFTYGTLARAVFSFGGTDYYKFCGKLVKIDPEPGSELRRRVHCEAVDWIDEAAEFTVRDVVPQFEQRADELITAIIDSMPASAEPTTSSFDVGNQAFTYALYDLGLGEKALRVIAKIVQSEFGFFAVVGDTSTGGVARFWNRHARANISSSATISNTMVGVEVPSTLDNVYNDVKVTTHPLRTSEGVVIWSVPVTPASVRPLVDPNGGTKTFILEYRDPDGDDDLIGAVNGIAPVETTDYQMNTAQSGLGSDISSDCTVVATYNASSVTVVVTNNHASEFAHIQLLQGRGDAIFDRAPVLHESSTAKTYGTRTIDIDMPYQNDANIGLGIAQFVDVQYNDLMNQANRVLIQANVSSALMTQVLAREPGDKITITESMTGLSGVEFFIQAVRLQLRPGNLLWCEWTVANDVEGDFWILGVADDLDTDTVLGYA